jgi:cytochrome P450
MAAAPGVFMYHFVLTLYALEFVDSIVEKAISHQNTKSSSKSATREESRYVLLHELISQTTDTVKIRSELLNILFAGRDTTASFLSNLWFELSKRPDVWATLYQEVDSTFPDGERPVSFEQLKNMKYLRAVLNESLRLYPIVPNNNRTALTDAILPLGGGENGQSPLFVPKGQIVGWDVYTLHRRKDIYGKDADVFKPERWLDSDDDKGFRPGWAYLPFNGGPRTCIGRTLHSLLTRLSVWHMLTSSTEQFALTEASYVTVRLMQEFASLESRDPEPWREVFTLTCSGLGGCKVALHPRA